MVQQSVPMPGAMSNRTDKNIVEKTSKNLKKKMNIQSASGGAYGERQNLQSIASGASTNVPTVGAAMAEKQSYANPAIAIPPVDAFAPGSGGPLSDGAAGGPGRGSEIQMTPVDAPDQGSAFARALLRANPDNRQLRMIVEAFNEEGR